MYICKIGYRVQTVFSVWFSEANPEKRMRRYKDYYTMQDPGLRLYVLKYLIMTAK